MSVLLIEKTNHRFKRLTKTRQTSGLTVCLDMIADSIDGVTKISVDQTAQIDLAIQRFKPQKIIFQAIWITHDEIVRLQTKYPRKKFYVHLHSNIPFLSVEGYAFDKINEARKLNLGLICNDRRAAMALDGIHLPNVYNAEFMGIVPKEPKDHIDVVCAGSLRPMKNQVIQAIAAINYAKASKKKLNFHMNIERSEGGNEILSNLKALFRAHPEHSLLSVPWLEHRDFIKFLTKMDVGLQVSMSESFNIVAADYVAAGLPMVVSDEISWASNEIKAKTGDADSILWKMVVADRYVGQNRQGLEAFNSHAKGLWKQFVEA